MTLAKLTYPILITNNQFQQAEIDLISPKNNVWVKSAVTNPSFYNDIIYFDSNGGQYKIDKIEIIGYTNKLWGFNISNFNQTVYTNTFLTKESDLKIDEFKDLAKRIAKDNEDYYISSAIDIEQVILNIDQSSSYRKIMESLELHHPFEFPTIDE